MIIIITYHVIATCLSTILAKSLLLFIMPSGNTEYDDLQPKQKQKPQQNRIITYVIFAT